MDYFVAKGDMNYLLFMCLGMIAIKEKEILKRLDSDQLHYYVNRELKTLTTTEEVAEWLKIS